MPTARNNVNKALWENPQDTFATVLLVLFLDRFGTEALEWSPDTITLEVEEEFNVDLKPLALDKLMVGIQLLTTNKFYKSTPDFVSFCNILNGESYRPDMWDPADAEDVAWGITEAMIVYPPEDDDPEPFTEEIRAYIGSVLDDEGLINPPDVLRIALRQARVSPTIEDFSDDPSMFNAVYDLEEGKRSDIENTVKQRINQLQQQLQTIQLENGSTQEVLKALNRMK
jgi:hypothetical protein